MMKNQSGLTLMELMAVLALVAVLVSAATPGFQSITMDNRQAGQINHLSGHLSLARSEAVGRGVAVSICGSTDQQNCDSEEWEQGQILYVDLNGDGMRDGAEEILKIIAPLTGSNSLRRVAAINPADDDYNAIHITFRSDGTMDSLDASSLILCDDRGPSKAKALTLNAVGQIRSAIDNNNDQVVDIPINGTSHGVSCP